MYTSDAGYKEEKTMADIRKPTKMKWMCTQCGRKEVRPITMGRPMPGKCSRRGGDKPHSWVQNGKI